MSVEGLYTVTNRTAPVTVENGTADPGQVKSSLRRLAGPDDREVIDRATAAIDDIDAAAAFVDSIGLDRLESAIEATDNPGLERQGRRVLDEYRQFRRVAAGERPGDHFHRGHGTDLRGDAEAPTR